MQISYTCTIDSKAVTIEDTEITLDYPCNHGSIKIEPHLELSMIIDTMFSAKDTYFIKMIVICGECGRDFLVTVGSNGYGQPIFFIEE